MGLTVVPGNMIEDGTVTVSNFDNTTITSADMAVDPRNASNYTSGDVPLAQLGNVPAADLTGIDDDLALLGFKTAANGSLAKYNLLDQTVDAFEDASGVDAGSSTNEIRDSSGKYYSGTTVGTITAFTSAGAATWTAPRTGDADVLIVAGGGGGGGRYYAGGGGAGGIVHDTDYAVTASIVYDLSVGAAGAGGAQDANGSNGSNSVWNVNAEGSGITMTAVGGGGGSTANGTAGATGSGGGGAGGWSGTPGGAAGQPAVSGATVYANAGGAGAAQDAAGGGGAGAAGTNAPNASPPAGGAGGIGFQFTTFGAYGTDSSNSTVPATGKGYFGGGGGGSSGPGPNGDIAAGGAGGGGAGGRYAPAVNPVVGTANTGGGGGGGTHQSGGGTTGAAGGLGIILIKAPNDYTNMTLVSTATTAQAVPTKGDMVMTYTNGVGTAVINTNIKGYVSRDGGTTYTEGTLVSQGTTGGHTIASFHDLDISGQPSGSSMRYKIETLVQSAALATRIQAVSLGWS